MVLLIFFSIAIQNPRSTCGLLCYTQWEIFQPRFFATALAIHRAANLEYLAVGILVQNLLDGDVQRWLSLAEGKSVAGTARVHGARRESHSLQTGISPPVPEDFAIHPNTRKSDAARRS